MKPPDLEWQGQDGVWRPWDWSLQRPGFNTSDQCVAIMMRLINGETIVVVEGGRTQPVRAQRRSG